MMGWVLTQSARRHGNAEGAENCHKKAQRCTKGKSRCQLKRQNHEGQNHRKTASGLLRLWDGACCGSHAQATCFPDPARCRARWGVGGGLEAGAGAGVWGEEVE